MLTGEELDWHSGEEVGVKRKGVDCRREEGAGVKMDGAGKSGWDTPCLKCAPSSSVVSPQCMHLEPGYGNNFSLSRTVTLTFPPLLLSIHQVHNNNIIIRLSLGLIIA